MKMQSRRLSTLTPNFLESTLVLLFLGLVICAPAQAQTCPPSYGTTDSAKSHKLYLYFPAADDNTFPNYGANVSPAKTFDAAALNSGIGTTAALIDRIHSVVVDDYCEFNVQVLATTTNPATLPMPPAKRTTLAVGSDSDPGGAWGLAQEVDIGDAIDPRKRLREQDARQRPKKWSEH
jgi:hypothetical protein